MNASASETSLRLRRASGETHARSGAPWAQHKKAHRFSGGTIGTYETPALPRRGTRKPTASAVRKRNLRNSGAPRAQHKEAHRFSGGERDGYYDRVPRGRHKRLCRASPNPVPTPSSMFTCPTP